MEKMFAEFMIKWCSIENEIIHSIHLTELIK